MTTQNQVVNPWIVAIAVMCATFMEVLDTTVVNVSLPHIAGDLSATIDEATLALTSYLVANAIVLPITGWLASRFGRKNLLIASVIGFTSFFLLLRTVPEPAVPDRVPRLARGVWWMLAAFVAGRFARGVSTTGLRESDGVLGLRDRGGTRAWSSVGRLAD